MAADQQGQDQRVVRQRVELRLCVHRRPRQHLAGDRSPATPPTQLAGTVKWSRPASSRLLLEAGSVVVNRRSRFHAVRRGRRSGGLGRRSVRARLAAELRLRRRARARARTAVWGFSLRPDESRRFTTSYMTGPMRSRWASSICRASRAPIMVSLRHGGHDLRVQWTRAHRRSSYYAAPVMTADPAEEGRLLRAGSVDHQSADAEPGSAFRLPERRASRDGHPGGDVGAGPPLRRGRVTSRTGRIGRRGWEPSTTCSATGRPRSRVPWGAM